MKPLLRKAALLLLVVFFIFNSLAACFAQTCPQDAKKDFAGLINEAQMRALLWEGVELRLKLGREYAPSSYATYLIQLSYRLFNLLHALQELDKNSAQQLAALGVCGSAALCQAWLQVIQPLMNATQFVIAQASHNMEYGIVQMAGFRLDEGGIRPSPMEVDLRGFLPIYQKIIDLLEPPHPDHDVGRDGFMVLKTLADAIDSYGAQRDALEKDFSRLEAEALAQIPESYVYYIVIAESYSVKFCLYLSEVCAYQASLQLNNQVAEEQRPRLEKFIKPLVAAYIKEMQKNISHNMVTLRDYLLQFLEDEKYIHIIKQTIGLQQKALGLLNKLLIVYMD